MYELPKTTMCVVAKCPFQSLKFVSSFRDQIVARPGGNVWRKVRGKERTLVGKMNIVCTLYKGMLMQ